jgi:hypothetical protein
MINENFPFLNSALIIISLVLAIELPFELFLFAYAILGPLHYLTEINWLNNSNFYVRSSNHIWIVVALTLLVSLPTLLSEVLTSGASDSVIYKTILLLRKGYGSIIFITFLLSLGLVYSFNFRSLFLVIIAGTGISYVFRQAEPFQLITAFLLPSLIHVYLFTLLFMIGGAIKAKRKLPVLEVALLFLVPFVIAFLPNVPAEYSFQSKVMTTFLKSNFDVLNIRLGKLFAGEGLPSKSFIISSTGIKIQTFIAFSYLYHYLNWFSKISLIGWLKNTSGKKIGWICFLWICSVGLYFYDYAIGLTVLFFLSLLHVTLEFPLNIISIQNILSFCKEKFYHLSK